MLKELLENENKYYKDLCKQQENEIERLNNIINEVREYIKNNTWEDEYGGDIIEDYNHKLLDILKKDKQFDKKIK